jgi:putative ABC transport system permease protein
MRTPDSLSCFLQDLRYGARMLQTNPGFTAATVLTLALAIGANTAMFSVVDAVVFRPLPYRDADRLAAVWDQHGNRERAGYSEAAILEARGRNRVFENLAGWTHSAFNVSGQGLPERVEGLRVSWDFLQALGVTPALGRSLAPEDDRPGAPRVAVISHGMWQRKFGGDARVVGRSVLVDGRQCTLIGVMPAGFRFFYGPDVLMPLALNPADANPKRVYISAVGRLRSGMTPAEAGAQWGGLVEPLRAATRQDRPRDLLVLFGAVGFVLLIGCVNVANLLLARAAVRRRELAVRASLGAGRGRLVGQLLTESLPLALAGGFFGLFVAFWVIDFLPALAPPVLLSGCAEIGVDWRVLGFTLALSIVTGLLCSAFPAWRASRADLHEVLNEGARGSTGGSSQSRLRSVLVVAEVSLSLVLLACAGLLMRSLLAMQRVDLGFRSARVVTMRLSATEGRYNGPVPLRAFYRQVLDKAASIPGVLSASISMAQAPWGSPTAAPFDIAGHPKASASEFRGAVLEAVSPDYFRTVGIRLVKGRAFGVRDSETAPRVAIVNQTFVKVYLARLEPLGQRLLLGGQSDAGKPLADVPTEIVGVVGDVKFGGPTANGVQMIYLPVMQSPRPDAALALRTSREPLRVAQAARAALAQIDRDTPVTQVKTMDQIVLDSMAKPRTQAWLIGVFAALALVMAALGNYGLMSYSVAQSTHDMGVRMALGAGAHDVLRLVLRKGVILIGVGLLTGIGGALALTRLISRLLFNVKPTDPWTLAVVALLLGSVTLAAAYIPARRATRVDPSIALRVE